MKIPIELRDKTITGEAPSMFMPIEAGTAVNRAVAQAGQGISEVTNKLIYLEQVYETQKKKARDAIELATAEAQYDKMSSEFKTNAMTEPNYSQLPENWNKTFDNKLLGIVDSISNPNAKKIITQHLLKKKYNDDLNIANIANRRDHEAMQGQYLSVLVPNWQAQYSFTDDPDKLTDIAQGVIAITNELLSTGVITGEMATAAKYKVFHDGELMRAHKIVDTNPQAVANGDITFDNLKELTSDDKLNLQYRAERILTHREAQQAKEIRETIKEQYNKGSQETYDRFISWNEGKQSQDKVNFFSWLDRARETDTISERTYEIYNNKALRLLERQDKQAEVQAQKMTPDKWVAFGKIKNQFLDPSNNLGYEDIGRLPQWLQDNNTRIGELTNILANRPSKERAKILSIEEQFINKKLKDAEASPETWERIKAMWSTRIKDTADKDIPALAKELVTDLPDDSITALFKRAKEKKESQKGFLGNLFGGKKEETKTSTKIPLPSKGLTYNPITGEFTEIKP